MRPRDIDDVLDLVARAATPTTPAFGIGVAPLLALLTSAAVSQPGLAPAAQRLYHLVRSHHLLDLEHLLADSSEHRASDVRVGSRVHCADAWKGDPTEWVHEVATHWLSWSDRCSAQGVGSALPHLHYFAAGISTIATALGMCATWQGVALDCDRLARGLAELPGRVDETPEGRMWGALLGNYEQAAHAADPHTGRVHPVYHLQRGHRLGSEGPNIQGFTHKGGEWSSRGLVVPDTGTRLVEVDIRWAEPLVLGLVWKHRYGDDRYLRNVCGGDIHTMVGQTAFPELPPAAARYGGKVINMTLTNGGGNSRIEKVVESTLAQGRQVVPLQEVKARTRDVIRRLEDAFSLRQWREELTAVSKGNGRGEAVLPYGRVGFGETGPTFASRLTQTYFADAFTLAAFHLVQQGYRLGVLVFDSILISLPPDIPAQLPASTFTKGFEGLLGVTVEGTTTENWERWSP